MLSPELLQLSQSHLSLLDQCPRKFQYTYLEQLRIPAASPRQDQQQRLGSQFHRLMQQHRMNLDVAPILAASPELNARFQAFLAHPPTLIAGRPLTEHRRTLQLDDILLVGIFDLLMLSPDQAQIVDWKSYQKPRWSSTGLRPSPQALQNHWQTRLYCYLLVETTALAPEQVSMIYWFSQTEHPTDSHTLTFPYSQSQHAQTQQQIQAVITSLNEWQQAGLPFPQAEELQGHCFGPDWRCPYLERCDRSHVVEGATTPEGLPIDLVTDFDQIPAIAPPAL